MGMFFCWIYTINLLYCTAYYNTGHTILFDYKMLLSMQFRIYNK